MDSLEGPAAVAASILLAIAVAALFGEALVLHFRGRRLRLRETRMSLLGVLSNALTGGIATRFWGPLSVAILASFGAQLSPLDSWGTGLLGWVIGWLIYEFWYWFQHWAAHKVRLLWCIHSPHHTPRSINMIVGVNHHLVEGTFYLPFFAGFVPALFGVDPLVCVGINILDMAWGSLLHLSEELVPGGRYGALGRVLQTPSYHRVHHATNPLYLDTNYNSITLFWDWLFGTLQPLRSEEPVSYGITRPVDSGSFWDAHFGEFVLLARDVAGAQSWGDRLRFALKPPGWAPGDASQTAASRKRAFKEAARIANAQSHPVMNVAS